MQESTEAEVSTELETNPPTSICLQLDNLSWKFRTVYQADVSELLKMFS